MTLMMNQIVKGMRNIFHCREYFLEKFFPSVWESEYGSDKFVTTSPYCKFDSQTLQLFQSSLYIAGRSRMRDINVVMHHFEEWSYSQDYTVRTPTKSLRILSKVASATRLPQA